MAGSRTIGKKIMKAKFSGKSFNENPDYVVKKKEDQKSDNQDIQGIKEIVSIVGGVVRTLKSFEESNKGAVASKADPNTIVQSRVIRENTRVMERLTNHVTNLGAFTKENTKALASRAKGTGKKIQGKVSKVISVPKNFYKKISGVIGKTMVGVMHGMRKIISPISKPISALYKVTRGGFKMIDNTLTKILGPMFMDMAKSLAVLAGIYIIAEGIRQSIWHLMKRYDEGFEKFTNTFGNWSGPLMKFAESIRKFSNDVNDKGFLEAIKNNTLSIISSIGTMLWTVMSRGFDHLIVSLNNWWHSDDKDKQMTVEEYRNRRVENRLVTGRGADYGDEENFGIAYSRARKKQEMTDQGLQYYINSGLENKLYSSDGSENMSGKQIADFLKNNNPVVYRDVSNHVRDTYGTKIGTPEHFDAIKDFYYDKDRKSNYESFVEDVGGEEKYNQIKLELSENLLEKNEHRFHFKDRESNLIFDESVDKDDVERGKYLGKIRRYSDGEIPLLAKDDALKTYKESGEMTGLDRERVKLEAELKRAFGNDVLGNTEQKIIDNKEEKDDVVSVIDQQKENLIANTKSINDMTLAITQMMGKIGGSTMMQNIKNNTTVINPKTRIEVIPTGVNL